MPSFNQYQKALLQYGKTLGEVRKKQSDQIMEATWYGDIATRTSWLFDMYHDPDPRLLCNMDVVDDMVPIDIKFVKHSSKTYDKDNITYHLQMKPSQENCVPYYEDYEYYYDSEWPLGLYILIPDEKGQLNRWLIVDKADADVTQFPTWEILRCDYCFQYILEGKRYEVAGVLRSQNSYNSGIWTDYKLSTVEDQQKFIVPLNRDTERIYYNQRMLIDANVLSEPRSWKVSKVNRISPNGLVRVTLAQDQFDQNHDLIETETDEKGRVIVVGKWANGKPYGISAPDLREEFPEVGVYANITCSGIKPSIKVGGNYKTLTVNFYKDDEEVAFQDGEWYYTINDEPVDNLIITDKVDNSNQAKIKFIGNSSYIGKILTVHYRSINNVKASFELHIDAI